MYVAHTISLKLSFQHKYGHLMIYLKSRKEHKNRQGLMKCKFSSWSICSSCTCRFSGIPLIPFGILSQGRFIMLPFTDAFYRRGISKWQHNKTPLDRIPKGIKIPSIMNRRVPYTCTIHICTPYLYLIQTSTCAVRHWMFYTVLGGHLTGERMNPKCNETP